MVASAGPVFSLYRVPRRPRHRPPQELFALDSTPTGAAAAYQEREPGTTFE
jgi:hypothetical protein